MAKRYSTARLVLPGVALVAAYSFSACASDAPPIQSQPRCEDPSTTATSGTGGSDSTVASSSTGGPQDDVKDVGETAGDESTTFDHFNTNPFETIAQQAEEGPFEVRTRLHSCGKIRYRSLGNFLASRGVDLNATGSNPLGAGELYSLGADALGAAQYLARRAEVAFASTAATTKLLDIFAQAAPEMIANLADSEDCPGDQLFDSDGDCDYEGFSCITARAMTSEDMTLCNLVAHDTSSNAQEIAVAVFLAAAHTCE